MVSTIRLISTISLLRVALAPSLLLPLAMWHEGIRNQDTTTQKSAGALETPHSAYAFVNSIGLNTHLNYFDLIYGNFPLVQRELQSVGVLHLRDGVHLQNQDYNATLFGRWIQLGQMGIRFDAVLDPRSQLGEPGSALLNQVDTLAGHTIESFEGPNEMDVSNESDWQAVDRAYQQKIFTAARAMQGAHTIAVVGPSLAFASHSSVFGDLSRIMDDGNLHPYPAGKMPSVVFPQQINLEKVICDNEPILFTESGYHNAINEQNDQPGVSEAAAAKYIPRLFLEDFARGVARTYLYELMDEAPEPALKNPQMHWGLIRADGSEKPAFAALKNLIHVLNDTAQPASLQPLGWALSSSNASVHHLLLQKSNGVFDLVLWQEVSSYDTQHNSDISNPDAKATLTLNRQARSIALYEPVKQSGAIQTLKSVTSVPLAIPDHPLIVEIAF